MDERERARALEQTLGQIEKQFGKGSIHARVQRGDRSHLGDFDWIDLL